MVSAAPFPSRARDDDLSPDEVGRRYRTLIEQLPLVVYLDEVDSISSNIFTSRQIEPILGYSVEEWAADPDLFTRLLHPDDRERVLAAHAHTHETHEPLSLEYRLIARDDRVVHLGGDEFAIVLTEPVTPDDAVGVAERLLTEIGRPLESASGPLYAGASIGIAFGSDDVTLLKEADIAMYRAKRNSEMGYAFFDAQL